MGYWLLNKGVNQMQVLIFTLIAIIVPVVYNEFKARWGL